MEEGTKIKNKDEEEWLNIFFHCIIGLFTTTQTFLLSLIPLSPSHFHLSCEPLLFDYLLCTAAVVISDSSLFVWYIVKAYSYSMSG